MTLEVLSDSTSGVEPIPTGLPQSCMTKVCAKCQEEKALQEFGKQNRRGRVEILPSCKVCRELTRNKWRKDNLKRCAAALQLWRRRNPGKNAEFCKSWIKSNPEWQKKYLKNRRKTDIEFHIYTTIGNRIRMAVIRGYKKSRTVFFTGVLHRARPFVAYFLFPTGNDVGKLRESLAYRPYQTMC